MASSGRSRKKTKVVTPYLLWCVQILISLFCITGIYLLWLDARIQKEFEGKRWSLPARVYASPIELYPGLLMTKNMLRDNLFTLGYVANDRLQQSGQFKEQQNAIALTTRPVTYWTGKEAARSLQIDFQEGQIGEIIDLDTASPVGIVRLEPELIGKIYPQHNEDRNLLQPDEIPEFLIKALLAVEDRGFYRHHGLDLRGLARAIYTNIRKVKVVQGGSTLTQQLVKNFFLSHERTLWRKLNEMAMALLLERHYSKQEILTAYCNEIYLGQHGARAIHGFGTASEFYYGRPLAELNSEQLALLVALVRGATYYDPREHPERAQKRRDLVLEAMVGQGYVSRHDADVAQRLPLGVIDKPAWTSAKYPAFLDLVRRQLLRDYTMSDLQDAGLKIFTTLDTTIQKQAQINAGLKLTELQRKAARSEGKLQMAAVIVRIGTGDILSLIGGSHADPGNFNRALDARRPIGSLIKPIIYLTALSAPHEYNLLTPLADTNVTLKLENGTVWKPDNYDKTSHGMVYLYDALKHSYNLATVHLGLQLGLDKVIGTLHKAGIDRNLEKFPSLLLGSVELTPMEVTQMYQTIANGGFQSPLNSISAVLDSADKPLQRFGLQVEQTLAPAPVFLVNHILGTVVAGGTARSLQTTMADKLPLAGKTGTTNDLRDSWFAGFGDNLLAVTWIGYDDNHPTRFTGATGALQLWAAMMRDSGIQPVNFIAPEDIGWLSRHKVMFNGNCPDLPLLPYITNHKPSDNTGCYSG